MFRCSTLEAAPARAFRPAHDVTRAARAMGRAFAFAAAVTSIFLAVALSPVHAQRGGEVNVDVIPPDRRTVWRPGLTHNGGFPEHSRIHATIAPRGGGADDSAAIQAALNTCPPGSAVKLSAGTFSIGQSLNMRASDCVLRGSGTGELGTGNGGTRLMKVGRGSQNIGAVIYVGNNPRQIARSIPIVVNAEKGARRAELFSALKISPGSLVLIDQRTDDDPRVWWGPEHAPPGGVTRSWFSRQDRSLAQIMEVASVDGRSVTFTTPFHITFEAARNAELSIFSERIVFRSGVEDLYVHGGQTGHGNISVSLCAYCWIRNVESHWAIGPSVSLLSTFRSEIRDSYIHETPSPHPGGGGYLLSVDFAASDNLIENNVLWNGNKNMVMRASGGGNVVGYNYLDDSYGANYPNLPEVGLNASHYTTPHMELLEGNYSHNYVGETFWGNSIYITVLRNHLSGLRAARPPLNTYRSGVYPYMDFGRRAAVEIQSPSNFTNLVGNVLGFKGQTLLRYPPSGLRLPGGFGGYSEAQTAWNYERLSAFPPQGEVNMWLIGSRQAGGWSWIPATYETQLREGNWDWVTRSQRWHGIGGAVGSSSPKTIPNSLYLSSKPDFFGPNPWPWVDPQTGEVAVLPAKSCLEAGKMPTCHRRSR